MKTTYYAIISNNRIEAETLTKLRKEVRQFVTDNELTYASVSRLYCEKNGVVVRVFER